MEMIVGAIIFGVGAFCGAWFFAAGQQMRSNRASQKIQDAFVKSMERATNEREHN